MRQALILLLAIVAVACGGHAGDGQAPPADEAVARGHEAAWTVAHADHTDTIALQRAILNARATHDEYVLTEQDEAAADFEQAFADSLRRADPGLAGQLFDN